MKKEKRRCEWPTNELMVAYHDDEWGVPVHDDVALFEALILGGAQAGLSWDTILKKRENYRKAFSRFNPGAVARYDKTKVARLLENPGIVRNRLKVESAIHNAKEFVAVQKEFGSFDAYVWRFVGGKPKKNRWKRMKDIPVTSKEAEALSKDLKTRGFKFVGPTICYAVMQAVGMVNDHTVDCFRYRQVGLE